MARSLSDIAVRDEAKEVWPDARPQAWKNRRCIRWNPLRIFSGRERRRWSQIVRRSRKFNIGQAPSNNKPANRLRCGNIKATIWENVSENGGISPERGAMGLRSVSLTLRRLSPSRVTPRSGLPLMP